MAQGWKHWTGQQEKSDPHAQRRNFRLGWIQGKRDPEVEKRLTNWICKIIGQDPQKVEDFGEWLRDGQILCMLMAKLQPGCIKRVMTKGDFALMQNVNDFRGAALSYGLMEEVMFSTRDLYEQSNLCQVASTLTALAEIARFKDKNVPEL